MPAPPRAVLEYGPHGEAEDSVEGSDSGSGLGVIGRSRLEGFTDEE